MKHLTLFELHRFIQRVFYLNFEESVWIEAEIAESRVHNGHIYMTLIEKDPTGQLVAKASCSLWRNKVSLLKNKLGSLFPQVVKTGNKVKLRCKVEFHARYGYSLHAEDFDGSYTEGFLHLERQKTIQKLKKENLFELNKNHAFPLVIKRIALVSSPTAAGYQDFIHQLNENTYGYHYKVELFSSAMQGDQVQNQFTTALATIEKRKNEFDIIVVVRGGGATVDLSDFDNYDVAASVARSSLPVVAGIGHERDISVTDMVAYARVKTPTAAAEAIIENNLRYETYLHEIGYKIRDRATAIVNQEVRIVYGFKQSLSFSINSNTENERFILKNASFSIHQKSRKHLHNAHLDLTRIRNAVIENNPMRILERGFAMIYQNEHRVRHLDDLDLTQPVDLYMNKQKITLNER